MFALANIILFGLVLAGVGIVFRGWFGPRLDDHPHCAKCHYDLTGLKSDHCPECGTFIASEVNIVHSQRVRDWRRIFMGLGLIAVLGAGWYALDWWQEELRSRPLRLAAAVRTDDVKTVKAFIAADPSLPDWRSGMGPEELALRHNAQNVLALLLARHPRGQVPAAEKGMPLLHVAVTLPGGVSALLRHGVPVDARDGQGNTALHVTMREIAANKSWVKTLLEAGADPNARNALQETPLHFAFLGHDEVKVLIAAGADVNAKDAKGRTPLHHAMLHSGGYVTAGTESICGAGADLCARDLEGKTPGQLAQSRDHGEVATQLWRRRLEPLLLARDLAQVAEQLARDPGAVKYGAGKNEGTLLHWAAARNDLEFARILLDSGADPNALDPDGATPLWRANAEICSLLIQRGANVNLLDKKNRTALHGALDSIDGAKAGVLLAAGPDLRRGIPLTRWMAMCQHPDARKMQKLLDAGVPYDIFAAIVLGETQKVRAMLLENPALVTAPVEGVPLIIPAIRSFHRQDDIAQLLLDMGADPNMKPEYDDRGRPRTPLHEAMSYSRKNLVRMLLEHGADPNLPSYGGERALHWAVWRDAETARLILEHGAEVNARDSRGRTPLHAAAEFPTDPEVVKLLLAAGGDLSAKDNNGRTPIQCATTYPKVRELLASAAATRPTSQPAAQ